MRFIDTAGFSSTTDGHERCTADACQRNNVDLATYTQQHWPPDCQCPFLKPDLSVVLDILDAGCFPVVRLDADGRSLAIDRVQSDNRKMDYIAFSHVWADGLGSTTEVGLPSCQVRRLHCLAETRTRNGAFWVDSLCVPKQEPHRGKAVQMMKHTYKNATGVIVLDQGLQILSTKSSGLEIAWSVFASGWFGRLWTYQEGFLARWVDIELNDGLVDLYVLIQSLYDYYYDRPVGNQFPSVLVRELLAMLQKARPLDLYQQERSRSKCLVDLFNALTRRQTSRPSDQLLVIGLLLDLNIGRLMEFEGEEGWRAFYISLKKIPWTVVFDQRPKMRASSFKWAPSTWTSAGGNRWLHYDHGEADITERGWSMNLIVLALDEIAPTNLSRAVIKTNNHSYELSQAGNIAKPQLQEFNVIFVRYPQGEEPIEALQSSTSVWSPVGLGLKSASRTTRAAQLNTISCRAGKYGSSSSRRTLKISV